MDLNQLITALEMIRNTYPDGAAVDVKGKLFIVSENHFPVCTDETVEQLRQADVMKTAIGWYFDGKEWLGE